MRILEGVTVIDFTQAFSGPFCTMQLADFGARVIKIERTNVGDQSREWTPIKNGNSGYYAAINRNKESLTTDISTPEGVEMVKKLIKDADIIVENFKFGTMNKMGLGYDDIKEINPEIIYASISGFGQTGPLRNLAAYDNVVQAMCGIQEMTGFADGIPTRTGPAIGDNFTGITTCLGIVMAYLNKLNTGKGQKIDVAMMDTIFAILENPILNLTLKNNEITRSGNNDKGILVPYDVYKCKDGYFSVGLASDAGWPKFCKAVGMPELLEKTDFIDNETRCKNYDLFTKTISPYFADKTRAELGAIFEDSGVPNAPVLDIAEIVNHPQIKAREMVFELEDPGVGKYGAMGNPMKLSKTPAVYVKGAPLMGQDTNTILKSIGYSDSDLSSLKEKGII